MRSLRLVSIAGVLGSTVLLQTSLFAAPVFAHTHPTPIELDSPAVVFVQTAVKVEISLIEDSPSGGSVQLHQFTYTPVLAQGSGFAVDPSGVVVTDADLTHPDRDKAAIFAVNSAFHDQYGAPLPSDPFAKQSSITPTSGDRFVNERLQTCYTPNQTDRTGGCVVATTRQVVVFPFVTSQEKFGALPAKVLTPSADTSGVAVLKVGASNMPTVNLAQSIGDAQAIGVIGFTGEPSTQSPLVEKPAHFTAKGSGIVNSTGEDAKGTFQNLVDALGAGLRGGPAIGEAGQVIGLFQQPAPGAQVRLIDAKTVRDALSTASVSAHQGPTDQAFESAMHAFKNAQFQGAIPLFGQTLKYYPGHFIATQNLATAEKKKGTAADKTRQGLPGAASSDSGGGTNWLAPTLIALGVLLALAAAVLPLIMRRRRSAAGKARPAGAKPGPAGPRPATAGAKPAGVGPVGPKPASAGPVGPKPANSAPAAQGGHRADGGAARVPTPAGSAPPPSGNPGTPPLAQRSAAGVSVIQQQGEGQRAGHDVGARTFCTNCGQRLAANNRFCGSCGQPVE